MTAQSSSTDPRVYCLLRLPELLAASDLLDVAVDAHLLQTYNERLERSVHTTITASSSLREAQSSGPEGATRMATSYRDYAVPNSVSQPLSQPLVPEAPTDRSSKQAVEEDSAAKGAVVRQYDPEATPQEKAAATLLEAKSKVSPIAGGDPRPANVGQGAYHD